MERSRTLVGVGVGPGDPELVTVKAARVLASADAILVPDTGGDEAGRAESIVLAACPDAAARLVRVPFSMGERSGVTPRRAASWQASADEALARFAAGASVVAFATIGDPSVYSTFSYLSATVRASLPDVAVEVVPGITAMQALAAASRTPLVEGDEVLALVPLKSGVERLAQVAGVADTCVVYKAGRHFAELRGWLDEAGRDGIVGIDLGLPGEVLADAAEVERAPYFSAVLLPAARDRIGGRL